MQFFLVYTKSLHYKTRLSRGYLIHILLAIQNFTSQLFKSAIDLTPWPNSYKRGSGVEWGGSYFRSCDVLKAKAIYSHLHPSTRPPTKRSALVRIYPTNFIFFPQFHGRKELLCLLQLTELEEIKNAILEKYCITIQGFYRTYRLRKKFLQIRKGSLASRSTVLSCL